ncbi:MAG: hypothetical protein EBW07_09185 [Rhodobacteraceae bacterium]|nr:hypothetical protein [Paracoccaceae bacterium]
MLIAKELLEAFRDSFVNLDSEPLEAVTTPKSTITFTSTGETLNQSEMLDWAKSGACYQLQDFVILKDSEDCIAGTHSAIGMYMHGRSKSDEEKYLGFAKLNKNGDESDRPLAHG